MIKSKSTLQEIRPFSLMIRGVRKEFNLTQIEMCKILNTGQGTLSKIESNLLRPSLSQWLNFTEHFGLSPYHYRDEFLDRYMLKGERKKKSRIKLPKQYTTPPFIKTRHLIPLLDYCKTTLGSETFDKLIRSLGVDPDLLIIRDNQFNLIFFKNLMTHLIKKGVLKRSNIEETTQTSHSAYVHGEIFWKYNVKDPLKKITRRLYNNNLYEGFSKYKYNFLDDKHLNVIRFFKKDLNLLGKEDLAQLEHLESHYMRGLLKNFVLSGSQCAVNIEEKSYHFIGGGQCQYLVSAIQ